MIEMKSKTKYLTMDRTQKLRQRNSQEFEDDLGGTPELASHYSQQLDNLLSSMYDFVDVEEETDKKPILEPNKVEHTISFNFLSSQNENYSQLEKRKAWKPKPKFCDEVTYEDMCSIVVSGEWVLNKQGIYGKGRERRSELITGAVHSPALKKSLNTK